MGLVGVGDGLRGVLGLVRVGGWLRGVLGLVRVGIGLRGVPGLRGLQGVHLDGGPRQVAEGSRRQQALVFKLVETGPEPDAAGAA